MLKNQRLVYFRKTIEINYDSDYSIISMEVFVIIKENRLEIGSKNNKVFPFVVSVDRIDIPKYVNNYYNLVICKKFYLEKKDISTEDLKLYILNIVE